MTADEAVAVAFLQDQLICFFGDEDDELAIAELQESLQLGGEAYRARLLRGFEAALSDPAVSCLRIVRDWANRWVNGSEDEARAWLARVRDQVRGAQTGV